MSQLTDIYNSLMDDPDIIPPKDMSKNKYALNLAQQRIKQHEHNAEALELGFTKAFGPFAKGDSAVNRLTAFVNPPEAAPIELEKAADRPKAWSAKKTAWWKNGDFAGEDALNIEPMAVEDLEDKGYTRSEIADLVNDPKQGGNRYTKKDASMINSLSPERVKERIRNNEYSEEELDVSPQVRAAQALVAQETGEEEDPNPTLEDDPEPTDEELRDREREEGDSPDTTESDTTPKTPLDERLKKIDKDFTVEKVKERLQRYDYPGYTKAQVDAMDDDQLFLRAKVHSDNISANKATVEERAKQYEAENKRMSEAGYSPEEIDDTLTSSPRGGRNLKGSSILQHLNDNPNDTKWEVDQKFAADKKAADEKRAEENKQKAADTEILEKLGYSAEEVNRLTATTRQERIEQSKDNPTWKKDDIENARKENYQTSINAQGRVVPNEKPEEDTSPTDETETPPVDTTTEETEAPKLDAKEVMKEVRKHVAGEAAEPSDAQKAARDNIMAGMYSVEDLENFKNTHANKEKLQDSTVKVMEAYLREQPDTKMKPNLERGTLKVDLAEWLGDPAKEGEENTHFNDFLEYTGYNDKGYIESIKPVEISNEKTKAAARSAGVAIEKDGKIFHPGIISTPTDVDDYFKSLATDPDHPHREFFSEEFLDKPTNPKDPVTRKNEETGENEIITMRDKIASMLPGIGADGEELKNSFLDNFDPTRQPAPEGESTETDGEKSATDKLTDHVDNQKEPTQEGEGTSEEPLKITPLAKALLITTYGEDKFQEKLNNGDFGGAGEKMGINDVRDYVKNNPPESTGTKRTGTLANRLAAIGIDPNNDEAVKDYLTPSGNLSRAKIGNKEQKVWNDPNSEYYKPPQQDGEQPSGETTQPASDVSAEAENAAKEITQSDFGKKQAIRHGLMDIEGNVTEIGKEFFEKAAPMIEEAASELQVNNEKIRDFLGETNTRRFVTRGGQTTGLEKGTFLTQLLHEMNNRLEAAGQARLEAVYDEETGILSEGETANSAPDLSIALHPNDMRMVILNSTISNTAGQNRDKLLETLESIAKISEESLVQRGLNRDVAKRVAQASKDQAIESFNSGESTAETVTDDYDDNIDQQPEVQEVSNKSYNWDSQPALGERVDPETGSVVEPTTDPETGETTRGFGTTLFDQIGLTAPTASTLEQPSHEETETERLERERRPLPTQQQLPGMGDKTVEEDSERYKDMQQALDDAREKDKLANRTPRQRKVDELKKVMHGDLHEHLDNPDDIDDKAIDKLYQEHIIKPKTRTAESAEEEVKPTQEEKKKTFNREKALKRLARLQNPHITDENSDEFEKIYNDLEEHYAEDVGYTDKDIQDALKAQGKLNQNQEAQQNQERQNRSRGADQLRATTEFAERFPEPAEDMTPEEAKAHLRELVDFQHRDENFHHFGAKTGDPDDFKALRERLNQYAKINPSAAGEIAKEIQSAEREGIQLGSDEFLDHAKELKETADREQRTADGEADHKAAKLAHALENGNFSRGYDKDGNEVHHRLDHNGDPEHDTSEREHEDDKPPLVHATDENGYPDEEVQNLVNEIHDAKLAQPQLDRDHQDSMHQLRSDTAKKLKELQRQRQRADGDNNLSRDNAHSNNDYEHDTTQADIDERERQGGEDRANKLHEDVTNALKEHNADVDKATEAHEQELADHDDDTATRQKAYDAAIESVDKAHDDHKKALNQASTDRLNEKFRTEREAELAINKIKEETTNKAVDLIATQKQELIEHNQKGRDLLGKADAETGYLEDKHVKENAALLEQQKKDGEEFARQQQAEYEENPPKTEEERGNVQQAMELQTADFRRSQMQQQIDLQETQRGEIQENADRLLGEGNELQQAGNDLVTRHNAQKSELAADNQRMIRATQDAADEKINGLQITHDETVREATNARNNALQEAAASAGHDISVEDDDGAAEVKSQLEAGQTSHIESSAQTRTNMQDAHGDYVEGRREAFNKTKDSLYSYATEDEKNASKSHDDERTQAREKHRIKSKTIRDAHAAKKEEIETGHTSKTDKVKEDHTKEQVQIGNERPAKDKSAADRIKTAMNKLEERFKDDPEKLEAILANKHLGRGRDDVAKDHIASGSGSTGEKDDEGEDKKPEKTRMVKDPKTGDMKKQYWIPGRGKGWVDEETYNASHGQNAAAAKDGKMMIYPQGHFDAGHGVEGDEDFRPPSAPMAAFGGNTFGIEHEGHADWDTSAHDDSLDHDGVIGRHLGSHPGITDHANFTAGGAPFEVDADSLGMGGIADVLGEGKGKPRQAKGGLKGQFFGESAQQRVGSGEFAAYGRAAQAAGKKFMGAANWLEDRLGQRKEGQPSAVDRLHQMMSGQNVGQTAANKMRSARQTGRRRIGGQYYGGHKPQNEKHANLQSELWRRLPKQGKSLFRAVNSSKARQLDTDQKLEDRQEQKSSLDQMREYTERRKKEIESRPNM